MTQNKHQCDIVNCRRVARRDITSTVTNLLGKSTAVVLRLCERHRPKLSAVKRWRETGAVVK